MSNGLIIGCQNRQERLILYFDRAGLLLLSAFVLSALEKIQLQTAVAVLNMVKRLDRYHCH